MTVQAVGTLSPPPGRRRWSCGLPGSAWPGGAAVGALGSCWFGLPSCLCAVVPSDVPGTLGRLGTVVEQRVTKLLYIGVLAQYRTYHI